MTNIFKYVPDPLFLILMGTSLFFGGYIHSFYDWSGAEQSREAPILMAAIGLLVCCSLMFFSLLWIPLADPPRQQPRFSWFHFIPGLALCVVVVATTAWCVISPATAIYSVGAASVFFALACAGLNWKASPELRWRIISLLGCLYLPFFWVTHPKFMSNIGPQLILFVTGLPAVFPALVISRLSQFHVVEHWGILSMISSVEILIGLWTIRLDTRRALGFQILMFMLATIGSLFFNAMLRA